MTYGSYYLERIYTRDIEELSRRSRLPGRSQMHKHRSKYSPARKRTDLPSACAVTAHKNEIMGLSGLLCRWYKNQMRYVKSNEMTASAQVLSLAAYFRQRLAYQV